MGYTVCYSTNISKGLVLLYPAYQWQNHHFQGEVPKTTIPAWIVKSVLTTTEIEMLLDILGHFRKVPRVPSWVRCFPQQRSEKHKMAPSSKACGEGRWGAPGTGSCSLREGPTWSWVSVERKQAEGSCCSY